jgi:hypothetical protein
MKPLISSNYSLFIIMIIIIIIVMIIFLLNDNSDSIYTFNSKEGFTSKIRETYRPYIRNIRLLLSNQYNKIKNTFATIIRKFGLI